MARTREFDEDTAPDKAVTLFSSKGLRVLARACTEVSVLRGIVAVALDVCCPHH